ncbi:MAG: tetratricopeptide repeat protein [Gammaproteobacteria bacterium]|nr:tetratricopeptide repeat protein [Gammaproteobacteria bacterium]
MADKNTFFSELKRRNVYRVGIAYIVVAWLALQALDIVVPILRAPEWFSQLILILLVIGLPFALIFAWAFEMTPEGLKREKDVDRAESITHETGQTLNRIIIGVLAVAVTLLLIDKFFLGDANVEPATGVSMPASDAFEVTATQSPSIAVLPFANMSADESSTYFSDGLADTLLHMLAQIREIRVAARTSSFQFRDQNTDIKAIANTLNVGTILEGSVQRAGNKVRVTAQLIEADTGFHLWSGNYDRDMDDIFAIQDEIAKEVVAALKVSLLGETAEKLAQHQTDNVEAYTEYLLGINDQSQFSFESLSRAERHFREAVRLDPDYALAWARLGDTYLQIENTGAGSTDATLEAARNAASRALEINPDLAAALAVLGDAEARSGNEEVAEQLLLRAITLEPNDITAKRYYARALMYQLRPDEAIAQLEQVLALDPLSGEAHNQLSVALMLLDRYEEAGEANKRIVEISPNSPVGYYREADLEYARGNWANAVVMAMRALREDPDDPELPMMIGDFYVAMEMFGDAKGWYDRASEVDAQHPVSRAAPLTLLMIQDTDTKAAAELARQLLDDGIDDRQDSQILVLWAIWRDAEKYGTHKEAVNYLRDHFPAVFADNPRWQFDHRYHWYVLGSMMLKAGDSKRGRELLTESLRRADAASDAFGPGINGVRMQAVLGNKKEAMDDFRAFADRVRYPTFWPVWLQRDPGLASIRNEPEFVEYIARLQNKAAEQRALLPGLLAAK